MTVNEDLHDAELNHQVNLQQYSAGLVQRIMSVLNSADTALAAAIVSAIDRVPSGGIHVEQIDALLSQVRMINAGVYQDVAQELMGALSALAANEEAFQAGTFAATIPSEIGYSFTRVAADQIWAAATAKPFQGRLLSEWAQSIATDRMTRIRDAVRTGIVEQQTTPQIIARIRGTRASKYADGIIQTDRRNAEAVVRTAVSHVAGVARDKTYGANADMIKAVTWLSTLDARTSELCRCRDGLRYDTVTHAPIGHSFPWLGGPGAAHWRCRSTSIPVTKSWKELGIDMEEFSPSTRASMDGQVPAETTYAEWFAKQSAARQDQIVGPTRGALMRSGGMAFDSLYTNRGEYLTLAQLGQRDAEAFTRAGISLP